MVHAQKNDGLLYMAMSSTPTLFQRYMNGSLVLQIIVGIVCGVILASISPSAGQSAGILGGFFVKALKGIAPVLVFLLVVASIANHKKNQQTHIKPVLVLSVLLRTLDARCQMGW